MDLESVRVYTGFNWLRTGSCEYGTEPSGSIKGREFLGQLGSYQLFKKNSAPWS
jgi:hypothetical protein